MKPRNLFDKDDRGVSPVIGVILMVAITVILAAVIGTFVLGLGDSLGDNQPSAQLSVSDTGDGSVVIEHNGGDEVDLNNLDIVARNDGSTVGSTETVTDITSYTDANDRLSVGETITLGYGSSGTTTVDNIRLIHTASDSIILDENVDITDFDSWATA